MKRKDKNKVIKMIYYALMVFTLFSGRVLAASTGTSSDDQAKVLNICSENGVKLALQIIGYAIIVIKIVIPVVLIVYGIIDVSKAVIDAKDGLQKNLVQFAKRCIAAILIFFVPSLIDGIFRLIIPSYDQDTSASGAEGYQDCFHCLFDPSNCKVEKYGATSGS